MEANTNQEGTMQNGTHIHTIDEFEAIRAEAVSMSSACPICERTGRKVHEQVKQATRREPAIFLCFQGFCVDCQMSFPIDNAQMALA
jgi:hypothetical protein